VITIIVPAHNEEDNIAACLDALLSQQGLREPWEIIVVDDGSADHTAEIVRDYMVKGGARAQGHYDAGVDPTDGLEEPRPRKPLLQLVSQSHLGAAAARNAGADVAGGDLILFTDADCRPQPNWASAIAGRLRAQDQAAVMGLQSTDQRSLTARFVQAEYDEKQAEMMSRKTVTFADTATVGFQAEAFHAAGGFDTALGRLEDTDLAFRLVARDHVLGLEPDAVVLHRHVSSAAGYCRRKYGFAVTQNSVS
jgi:glycosyltransferase involved in cell wall biosynthesis